MFVFVALTTLALAYGQTTVSHSIHGSSLMHVYMTKGPHDAYDLLDLNNDKRLTLKEFETYFAHLDLKGDGMMDLGEFVQSTGMMHSMAEKEFKHLDLDHSGILTRDEITTIFNNFDENSDKGVSEKEFTDSYGKIMNLVHHGMVVG